MMMTWRRTEGKQKARVGEGIFSAGRGLDDHRARGYDRSSFYTQTVSS